jgi:hypothetical protein
MALALSQVPDPREARLPGWLKYRLSDLRTRLGSAEREIAELRKENQTLADLAKGTAAAGEGADTYLLHESGIRVPLGNGTEVEFGQFYVVRYSTPGSTEAGRYGPHMLVIETEKPLLLPRDSSTVVIGRS